jgi:hypothetical protein
LKYRASSPQILRPRSRSSMSARLARGFGVDGVSHHPETGTACHGPGGRTRQTTHRPPATLAATHTVVTSGGRAGGAIGSPTSGKLPSVVRLVRLVLDHLPQHLPLPTTSQRTMKITIMGGD